MKLVILDDYDLVSEWAAKYVRNRINQFKPGPGRHFVLGLPTGMHFTNVSWHDYSLYYLSIVLLFVKIVRCNIRFQSTPSNCGKRNSK